MTRVIVIDDLEVIGKIDSSDTLVVSWNTFSDRSAAPLNADVVHLGDALHDREDALQQSLLHWLGSLAHKHTSPGSPLPFVLPNLHSWWLLKISEKNYATSPEFTTLLKLALLRDICDRRAAERCDYFGADQKLESAIAVFAVNQHLSTNARGSQRVSLRERLEIPQAIFHFFRAFGVASFNLLRPSRRLRVRKTHHDTLGHSNPVGFVGYLLPSPSAQRAHSPYWGSLRDMLTSEQSSVWLYHRSDEVSRRDGRAFCDTRSSAHEAHCLIDDFFTLRVLARAVSSYVNLVKARKSFALDVPRSVSALGGLGAEQLFAPAVRDSLTGSHAVRICIEAHAYESLLGESNVRRWYFLWENKAFEHSLVSATQRHGNIESVGYAHSVVRKRDHRYYNELRLVPITGARTRPTASLYVVNGPLPLANIERIGSPDAPLRLVEALRYLSLSPRQSFSGTDILVVGDIATEESRRLIVATIDAVRGINNSHRILFKPHPGNLSQSVMARDLGCVVTTEPLANLAPSLAFAVVGVAGAASLDLTLLEVPVVTLLDGRTENLSPLAGVEGASFARTSDDLRRFAEQSTHSTVEMDSVMTLTSPPVRWSTLLNGTL